MHQPHDDFLLLILVPHQFAAIPQGRLCFHERIEYRLPIGKLRPHCNAVPFVVNIEFCRQGMHHIFFHKFRCDFHLCRFFHLRQNLAKERRHILRPDFYRIGRLKGTQQGF